MYAQIPAGLPAEGYPTVDGIKSAARAQGIEQRLLLPDEALEKHIAKARENGGEEYLFPVAIEPTFDVRISVSPNKLSAKLYVRKATEGTPLDMRLIESVIGNCKLANLDMARVKADLEDFRKGPRMELVDYALAEGTPPGRGQNREFVCLAEELPEETKADVSPRALQFIAKQGGSEDITAEELRLAMVKSNTVVLSFSPAEPGTPGTDVQGREIPGLPGNDPFVQSLYGASLGPQGIKTMKEGLLAVVERAGVYRVWVMPYLDAKVTINVTSDKMLASISLEGEEGAGKPLTPAFARESIDQMGIKGEIDEAAIAAGIKEALSSGAERKLTLIKGKHPVKAGGPKIEWKVTLSEEAPSVHILKDETILSWSTAKADEDGVNVFGEVLKAGKAEKIRVPAHDDTIRAEPEDPDAAERRLVATRSGELSLADGTLSIKGSKKFEGDVDESSGDLNFPGDLELLGNVAKGRVVRAEGSLSMKGVADAALVAAGGQLFIDGGIKGGGTGTAWSKQSIDLTFAENARVLAGQDIAIANYCFQCLVKTNGKLIMKGNPGVLLGGSVQASRGIEVFELGSSKTIRTSISFGQNYLVRDQIAVCEKEALGIKETLGKIDGEMAKLQGTDPRIQALRQKKLELLKRNEKLTVRIFSLKEQFEAHVRSSIRVENAVWPGVILESHGRYYEVRERRHHVEFTFDQATGQITCLPINDEEES